MDRFFYALLTMYVQGLELLTSFTDDHEVFVTRVGYGVTKLDFQVLELVRGVFGQSQPTPKSSLWDMLPNLQALEEFGIIFNRRSPAFTHPHTAPYQG